jgi:hypothetical protein
MMLTAGNGIDDDVVVAPDAGAAMKPDPTALLMAMRFSRSARRPDRGTESRSWRFMKPS